MEPELLGRLIDEHAAALELYAAQWTTVPEDVVQEAFIELVRQPERPRTIVPWLYRVVRNRAVSRARGRARRLRHEAAAGRLSGRFFVDHEPDGLDAERVTEALESLPDDEREIIVARIWGGLTFDELAELAGVSSSTAHRRYEQGLQSLRERLGLTWLTNPN